MEKMSMDNKRKTEEKTVKQHVDLDFSILISTLRAYLELSQAAVNAIPICHPEGTGFCRLDTLFCHFMAKYHKCLVLRYLVSANHTCADTTPKSQLYKNTPSALLICQPPKLWVYRIGFPRSILTKSDRISLNFMVDKIQYLYLTRYVHFWTTE